VPVRVRDTDCEFVAVCAPVLVGEKLIVSDAVGFTDAEYDRERERDSVCDSDTDAVRDGVKVTLRVRVWDKATVCVAAFDAVCVAAIERVALGLRESVLVFAEESDCDLLELRVSVLDIVGEGDADAVARVGCTDSDSDAVRLGLRVNDTECV